MKGALCVPLLIGCLGVTMSMAKSDDLTWISPGVIDELTTTGIHLCGTRYARYRYVCAPATMYTMKDIVVEEDNIFVAFKTEVLQTGCPDPDPSPSEAELILEGPAFTLPPLETGTYRVWEVLDRRCTMELVDGEVVSECDPINTNLETPTSKPAFYHVGTLYVDRAGDLDPEMVEDETLICKKIPVAATNSVPSNILYQDTCFSMVKMNDDGLVLRADVSLEDATGVHYRRPSDASRGTFALRRVGARAFSVSLPAGSPGGVARMYTAQGAVVMHKRFAHTRSFALIAPHTAPGAYVVTVRINNGKSLTARAHIR